MRADIHDGPEHNALQAEAGYIDARPYLPDRRNLLQRAAGPYIWVKSGKAQTEQMFSGLCLKADARRYEYLAISTRFGSFLAFFHHGEKLGEITEREFPGYWDQNYCVR